MNLTNNILVIGDVHCKIEEYHKIIQNNPDCLTVQVGDFGFAKEHQWHLDNISSDQHKILFGNHDDYSYLNAKHSLGSYDSVKYHDEIIMFVRGAESIDRSQRTPGIDWWLEEQLDYVSLRDCISYYEERKPSIMITHDCPDSVRKHLFGINDKTRTSISLEHMFEIHQPDLWIFGHHHKSKDQIINGTRFICLAELQTLAI